MPVISGTGQVAQQQQAEIQKEEQLRLQQQQNEQNQKPSGVGVAGSAYSKAIAQTNSPTSMGTQFVQTSPGMWQYQQLNSVSGWQNIGTAHPLAWWGNVQGATQANQAAATPSNYGAQAQAQARAQQSYTAQAYSAKLSAANNQSPVQLAYGNFSTAGGQNDVEYAIITPSTASVWTPGIGALATANPGRYIPAQTSTGGFNTQQGYYDTVNRTFDYAFLPRGSSAQNAPTTAAGVNIGWSYGANEQATAQQAAYRAAPAGYSQSAAVVSPLVQGVGMVRGGNKTTSKATTPTDIISTSYGGLLTTSKTQGMTFVVPTLGLQAYKGGSSFNSGINNAISGFFGQSLAGQFGTGIVESVADIPGGLISLGGGAIVTIPSAIEHPSTVTTVLPAAAAILPSALYTAFAPTNTKTVGSDIGLAAMLLAGGYLSAARAGVGGGDTGEAASEGIGAGIRGPDIGSMFKGFVDNTKTPPTSDVISRGNVEPYFKPGSSVVDYRSTGIGGVKIYSENLLGNWGITTRDLGIPTATDISGGISSISNAAKSTGTDVINSIFDGYGKETPEYYGVSDARTVSAGNPFAGISKAGSNVADLIFRGYSRDIPESYKPASALQSTFDGNVIATYTREDFEDEDERMNSYLGTRQQAVDTYHNAVGDLEKEPVKAAPLIYDFRGMSKADVDRLLSPGIYQTRIWNAADDVRFNINGNTPSSYWSRVADLAKEPAKATPRLFDFTGMSKADTDSLFSRSTEVSPGVTDYSGTTNLPRGSSAIADAFLRSRGLGDILKPQQTILKEDYEPPEEIKLGPDLKVSDLSDGAKEPEGADITTALIGGALTGLTSAGVVSEMFQPPAQTTPTPTPQIQITPQPQPTIPAPVTPLISDATFQEASTATASAAIPLLAPLTTEVEEYGFPLGFPSGYSAWAPTWIKHRGKVTQNKYGNAFSFGNAAERMANSISINNNVAAAFTKNGVSWTRQRGQRGTTRTVNEDIAGHIAATLSAPSLGAMSGRGYKAPQPPKISTKRLDKKLREVLPDGRRVYDVNGGYVRTHYNNHALKGARGSDFRLGGNHSAYPKFIPKGQIWVERNDNPISRGMYNRMDTNPTRVEIHEAEEDKMMRFKHQTYEAAHRNANHVESLFGRGQISKAQAIQRASYPTMHPAYNVRQRPHAGRKVDVSLLPIPRVQGIGIAPVHLNSATNMLGGPAQKRKAPARKGKSKSNPFGGNFLAGQGKNLFGGRRR